VQKSITTISEKMKKFR